MRISTRSANRALQYFAKKKNEKTRSETREANKIGMLSNNWKVGLVRAMEHQSKSPDESLVLALSASELGESGPSQLVSISDSEPSSEASSAACAADDAAEADDDDAEKEEEEALELEEDAATSGRKRSRRTTSTQQLSPVRRSLAADVNASAASIADLPAPLQQARAMSTASCELSTSHRPSVARISSSSRACSRSVRNSGAAVINALYFLCPNERDTPSTPCTRAGLRKPASTKPPACQRQEQRKIATQAQEEQAHRFDALAFVRAVGFLVARELERGAVAAEHGTGVADIRHVQHAAANQAAQTSRAGLSDGLVRQHFAVCQPVRLGKQRRQLIAVAVTAAAAAVAVAIAQQFAEVRRHALRDELAARCAVLAVSVEAAK